MCGSILKFKICYCLSNWRFLRFPPLIGYLLFALLSYLLLLGLSVFIFDHYCLANEGNEHE